MHPCRALFSCMEKENESFCFGASINAALETDASHMKMDDVTVWGLKHLAVATQHKGILTAGLCVLLSTAELAYIYKHISNGK